MSADVAWYGYYHYHHHHYYYHYYYYYYSVQSSSVQFHDRLGRREVMTDDSAEILLVFSAEGHCEQFWNGRGRPLFDIVHPAFCLPTRASPTLQSYCYYNLTKKLKSVFSADHGVSHPSVLLLLSPLKTIIGRKY